MDTIKRRDLDEVVTEMHLTRATLTKQEDDWKYWRAHSKKLTLELITEHGVSVAKAAQLSGHTRQTIKIWLDVWNAEHKSAKNQKR